MLYASIFKIHSVLTHMGCSLPLEIGSNVSVKDYNAFLDSQESTGYRFHFVDRKVYIVDMTMPERQAVIAMLQNFFNVPNGGVIFNSPIRVLGRPCKRTPSSLLDFLTCNNILHFIP